MNIYLEGFTLTLQHNGTAFDIINGARTDFETYEEALYAHRNEIVTQAFIQGPWYGKGNFMLRTSGSTQVIADEAFALTAFNIEFDESIIPPPAFIEGTWVASRMKGAVVIEEQGKSTSYE